MWYDYQLWSMLIFKIFAFISIFICLCLLFRRQKSIEFEKSVYEQSIMHSAHSRPKNSLSSEMAPIIMNDFLKKTVSLIIPKTLYFSLKKIVFTVPSKTLLANLRMKINFCLHNGVLPILILDHQN